MDPVILENAIEKKCRNYVWVLWIFILASTPGILNSMQITSHVFLGGNPPFFCNVPELQGSNWTNEQIKTISSPEIGKHSCTLYAWNYTLLKEIGFEESLTYYNKSKKPEIMNCMSYIYDEETPHQTIISQWNLVCENIPLKRAAQVGVALGKFLAAFFFGLLADRFGRKKIFVTSCLMYMAVGPAGAYVDNYLFFIVLRILVGVASSGLYGSGFTILSEMTVKNYRACVTSFFHVPYSIGFILLPLAAYLTNNWRQLQLAISIPTVFLLFHCWYLPESPRWLITRGKVAKATKIIGRDCQLDLEGYTFSHHVNKEYSDQCCNKVSGFLKSYFKLFSTQELMKRTLVCYFGWFVANVNYFALIMSGTNFTVNEHMYMALNGIFEAPSYILPPLILMYFGRKSSGMVMYIVSGLVVLTTVFVPQGWPVMCMAIIGRLSTGTAFCILSLQTTELIPTEYRSTAVGSCLAIAQLGTVAAPYIVDGLGKIAWWIPSSLCGSLSLVTAFFLLFVPETRGVAMLDTISEMDDQEKENLNKAAETPS